MRIVMSSAYVSQVAKGLRYREDGSRMRMSEPGRVVLRGDHHEHQLEQLANGDWQCDCQYYRLTGQACGHIRAVEWRLANRALPEPSAAPLLAGLPVPV